MSRSYFFALSFLVVFSCSKVNHIAKYETSVYELNDSTHVKNVSIIDSLIQPYKTKLDAEMNEVIGQSAKRLSMTFPEGTLGNFVADILFEKVKEHYQNRVDFAFINYWSIRIDEIPKGDITKGHVYELMPFENHLVIMKVDKSTVLKLFENMAKKGGWPISKQVKFQIKDGKPINVLVNGKPLKENYIYHLAVSNYIANGGDSCSFFVGQDRDEVDVMIRDMIMQGIIDQSQDGKLIDAAIEGRISVNQ